MKQHKILITGGTGYIGSNTIIEFLENSDYEVFSIDNYSRSTPETIQRITEITNHKIQNFKIDLCDKNALFDVLKQIGPISGIIHFAAYKTVAESVNQPIMYYKNNLTALTNILEACETFHINHLIFSSSCAVYGDVKQLPVNEKTPFGKAFCPYAHTKQIGEEMIEFFIHKYPELNAVILRYFNPVGAHISGLNGELSPDKPNNLVPIITQTAIGKIKSMEVYGTDYDTKDGSCIRDYIHVSDIANAHLLALNYIINKKNTTHYECFNLGKGNGISVLEMIEAFEKTTHQKLNYHISERRPGDIPAIYSDSSKAEKILGWKCRYDIQDMMASAWKWEQHLAKNSNS